jgi:Mg-chelatase subunit ChlD
MREKKSIKRAIALILAAVLAFTTFSSDITAIAAPSGNDSNLSVSTTTKDGIKLTKTAALNDDGTVNITFKVDGKSATTYINQTANTDIVLVLDVSSSMGDNKVNGKTRMELAKNAAVEFVTRIFNDPNVKADNVRIGVVKFGSGAGVVKGLSNKTKKNDLIRAINDITAWGNTFIQGGIREAEDMLANNNNNKVVVVMTDGEANLRYNIDRRSNPTSSFELNTEPGSVVPIVPFKYGNKDDYTLDAFGYGAEYNRFYESGWYTYDDFWGTWELISDKNAVRVVGTPGEGNTGYYDEVERKSISYRNVYQNPSNGRWYFNYNKNYAYNKYSNEVPREYQNDDYIKVSPDDSDFYRIYYYETWSSNVYVKADDTYLVGKYRYYDRYTGEKISVTWHNRNYYYGNKFPAVMEAARAKQNLNAKFYTVVYGTKEEDAIWAMKNIASIGANGEPLCFESSDSAIESVFGQIATQVAQDIAAANGTSIVDELPSYMSFVQSSGKYIVNSSSDVKEGDVSVENGKLHWDLSGYDLSKDKSYTLTVKCDLRLGDMITAYANDHRIEDEAVRALMSEGKVSFNLNKEVTLSYTDVSGNAYENKDITDQGENVNVPTTAVKTYEYDVKYELNGEEIAGATDVYYGYKGEKIDFTDALIKKAIKDQYPEASYEYAELNDKKELIVSDKTKESFTVKITSKYAHVKLVSDVSGGQETVWEDDVQIGSSVADPFVDADLKAQYEAKYNEKMSASEDTAKFDYSFSGWTTTSDMEMSNITGNVTFKANYANTRIKKFNVTFDISDANGAEWATKPNDQTDIEWGNKVTAPDGVIDVTLIGKEGTAYEDIERVDIDWRLNGQSFDFENTEIKSDLNLTAKFTITYKTYTVVFMDWDDTAEWTVENVKHGTTIPNWTGGAYVLADYEDDNVIKKHLGGWNTKKDFTGDTVAPETVVKSNLTLYPAYTTIGNRYTIEWKYLDRTTALSATETVIAKYNKEAAKPANVDTSEFWVDGTTYTFTGWTVSGNETGASTVDAVNGNVTSAASDVTFIANYSQVVDTFTFEFHYKDASGNDADPDVQIIEWGKDAVPPTDLPDYETVDENGDIVVHHQNGWKGDSYVGVKANGVATADETTTTYYTIEFYDSIAGKTISKDLYEAGTTPVAPTDFVDEHIDGNVKKTSTGFGVIVEATESKTYSTDVTTYYKAQSVHKYGDVQIGELSEAVWVLAGNTYTATEDFTYPYASGEMKFKRVNPDDSVLTFTPSEENSLLVIELQEYDKGTIVFYSYDGSTIIGTDTGYVGDSYTKDIPTTSKPLNEYTVVYTLRDGWFSDNKGTEAKSVENLKFESDTQNFFKVVDSQTRSFTLTFYNKYDVNPDKQWVVVDGFSTKKEMRDYRDNAEKPERESTHTEIFEGEWGRIHLLNETTNKPISGSTLDNWDYTKDERTAVPFITSASFKSKTRYYLVQFFMHEDDKDPFYAEKVVYEGSAKGPERNFVRRQYDEKVEVFTGWKQDLGPIREATNIYAGLATKHRIIYLNYDGEEVKRSAYPKYGKTSYDVKLNDAETAGAKKTFANKYSFKFEGWQLDNELLQPGTVLSLKDGDIVVKAKFEDYIPGKFYVKYPWGEETTYTSGVAVTAENFDYSKLYEDEKTAKGKYSGEDVAKVVKLDKAPEYAAFTNLEKSLPDLSSKNINATIDWYSVRVRADGIHVIGTTSYAHDTVDLTAVYDGTNLVDALYSQLLDKADGVMVSHDDFVEAFDSEIINKTNLTATITGTFVIGGEEEPVQEPIRPVADLVPTLRAVRAATPVETISVEMPISLSITARPAVITIHGAAKNDGDADPRFTYDITGEVAADPISVTLSRARGEAPGSYPITATVVASDNYDVSVIGANLRIDPVEENEPYNPPTEEEPPTGGEGGDQVTPPPVNPPAAGETPTQVAEVQELPTLNLTEPDVPLAAAPAEGKQGMKIEDEAVPMAVASQCFMHWIILAVALVYAIYATLRAVQNKKELEDNEEFAKNNN